MSNEVVEDSPKQPSLKDQLLQKASVMGEVLDSNQTLRAFFTQAASRINPGGRGLDGTGRAEELWKQGLERYPDAAADPAIAGLLTEFIASATALVNGKDS